MSTPPRVLRFDVFTLDLLRYVILRGDQELPLRPKAFDVLRYLAERPGRVVTKDELFEAVWGGAIRGDDTLVQCVKLIRQTLGDRSHQIIKAVPKRGYLFAAEVHCSDPTPAQPITAAQPSDPQVTAARPSPLPVTASAPPPLPALPWLGSARPFLHGQHRVSLLAACALLLTTGAGTWALWHQPAAESLPQAQAGHYAILGRALLDREHSAKANKEALVLFDKALALDPNSILALLGYARVLIVDVTDGWAPKEEHAARLSQAEAAIDRAVKLDPAHARAHHIRGFLWRARSDPDRALASFQHALELNPSYAWAHADVGRSRIDVGRADEAINDLETAMRLAPAEPRLFNWYYWAGMAAVHAGKSDIALHWLQKWREDDPLYYRLATPWLAVAYADAGRDGEARAVMAEYLRRNPVYTMSGWSKAFPRHNPAVAAQRDRIAAVLRRLGVPDTYVTNGSL